MKDFLGTTIAPGDTIVYPGRYSSTLFMNVAKVLEIKPGKLVVRGDGNSKNSVIHRTDLVTVVDLAR